MVVVPLAIEVRQANHLPMFGQEMMLTEEHPLVPVDFAVGHDRRRPLGLPIQARADGGPMAEASPSTPGRRWLRLDQTVTIPAARPLATCRHRPRQSYHRQSAIARVSLALAKNREVGAPRSLTLEDVPNQSRLR
jgi:hypothetical protein